MTPNKYGRRTEDVLDNLTPEALASLTDSQKMNLRIIQSISSVNTSISNLNNLLQELKTDVAVHDKILVTGNGVPSLQERLRNLETFVHTFQYWTKFVGGAIVVQSIAFFVGVIIALVRFLPLLEKIANP